MHGGGVKCRAQVPTEKKASKLDKLIAGGSSFFVDGLGQFLNGEGKKGVKFFLASVGTSVAASLGSVLGIASKGKAGKAAGTALFAASLAGFMVNKIAGIVDAP